MLLHLVDLADPMTEPGEAIRVIEGEVLGFSPVLASKPRWLVGTKLDALQDNARREAFDAICAARGQKPIYISGVTGEGLRELAFAVDDALKVLAGQKAAAPKDEDW
jgi:GTP-binding protein